MSGAQASRPSAVQRYLGPDTMPHANAPVQGETGPDDRPLERKSYCVLRGRFQPLPTLRLINRQGRVRSFDYGLLTGINMDRPDELVLHFEGLDCYSVTLQGQGLDGELLAALDHKRAVWVRELDDLPAAAARQEAPPEPVVTHIRISKGSVSREW